MIELEDLKPGVTLRGLAGLDKAIVVDAQWFGDQAVKVAYFTPEGREGSHVVSADELEGLMLLAGAPELDAATEPRLSEAAAALRQRRRRVSMAGVACTLFVAEIVDLIAAAVIMGVAWEEFAAPGQLTMTLLLLGAFVAALLMLFDVYAMGAISQLVDRRAALRQVWRPYALAAAVTALFAWLAGADRLTVERIAVFLATAGAISFVMRSALVPMMARWRAEGRFAVTVAVVGATELAVRLIEEAQALGKDRVRVMGVFDDRQTRVPHGLLGVPLLGNVESLLRFDALGRLDWIVVALPVSAGKRAEALFDRLKIAPCRLMFAPDLVDDRPVSLERPAGVRSTLDEMLAGPRIDWRYIGKAIEDRVLALALSLFLLPLLLALALLIRLDSKGPVLFLQNRFGRQNEIIRVRKFRTMHADAADQLARKQAAKDDPRVTRIGRFLRKSKLDELPQLINVLRGDMALVGPRPYAVGMRLGARFARDVLAEFPKRALALPGMTGWAQVNEGSGPVEDEAEFRRRLELDLYYLDHWSPAFDLLILWRTALAVLKAIRSRSEAAV
jgi:exopolysaccharide biosynthesis polyprenyl glycosylphosphotransferase